MGLLPKYNKWVGLQLENMYLYKVQSTKRTQNGSVHRDVAKVERGRDTLSRLIKQQLKLQQEISASQNLR